MGMFPCWKSHIFPQTAWRFDKICVYVSDLRINSRTGKDVWTWWAIILHQDSHQLFTLIKDFPTYSSPFPQQLLPEGLRKFCSSAVTFIRSGSGKIQLPWYQGIQYQPLSIPKYSVIVELLQPAGVRQNIPIGWWGPTASSHRPFWIPSDWMSLFSLELMWRAGGKADA